MIDYYGFVQGFAILFIAAPFIVGLIFKYFLLVPMPAEGMVVKFLDYIWYLEFLE